MRNKKNLFIINITLGCLYYFLIALLLFIIIYDHIFIIILRQKTYNF